MNTQEIFDKAVLGVVAQGKQSTSRDNMWCRYRGEKGLKCAVGHLIDDEYYNTNLENEDATNHDVIIAVSNSIGRPLTKGERRLLDALQHAHDGSADNEEFIYEFKERIYEVALAFNLNTKVF